MPVPEALDERSVAWRRDVGNQLHCRAVHVHRRRLIRAVARNRACEARRLLDPVRRVVPFVRHEDSPAEVVVPRACADRQIRLIEAVDAQPPDAPYLRIPLRFLNILCVSRTCLGKMMIA